MADRMAVVTGASSGIGRAAALALAGAGAHVALLALPGSGLSEVADRCRGAGVEAITIEADVGDHASVADAFERAEALAPVDAVFSGAGISTIAPAVETTDEQWARQLHTNLTGTFYVVREAARLMVRRQRGAIVTTASELAITGQAGYLAYTASKGGVLAMTRVLAAELAPHGVRANTLCPGPVETPLLAADFELADDPARERESVESSVAFGRIGRPEEIARAILFLLSDESSYMTGAQLVVDGGRTSCF